MSTTSRHIGTLVRASCVVALALGVAGCFVPVPEGPHTGVEGTDDTCHDRIDNNHNHMIDCNDRGCLAHGFCSQIIPLNRYVAPEGRTRGTVCATHRNQADCAGDASGICLWYPPPAGTTSPGDCSVRRDPVRAAQEAVLRTCTDRIDNDVNGHFDCGDVGCQSIFESCCVIEATNDVCRNLVDDDGNGYADCQENACKHPQFDFVNACKTETWPGQPNNCRNHLDDDRDRYIDCADRECIGDPLCAEICTDRVDNNDDGRIDCLDPNCFGVGACPIILENSDTLCGDGRDNDGNEYIDCADRGCAAVARCNTEHSLAACSDRIDNDHNGYVDCGDFSCTRPPATPEAIAYCVDYLARVGEASFARCTDGVDNDRNGYIDCADFSCITFSEPDPASDPAHPTVRSPCQESIATDAVANCSDGRDNDADGFIDCDDWDCNHNPMTSARCAMLRMTPSPDSLDPPRPLVCGTY